MIQQGGDGGGLKSAGTPTKTEIGGAKKTFVRMEEGTKAQMPIMEIANMEESGGGIRRG